MLSIARKRTPTIDFQFGNAEKLDFKANYFDLVFSVDVVRHISDRKSYFNESNRILKDGC
jgi:ubiquinone/menaquinone biosynthesis C-methylase UbiE